MKLILFRHGIAMEREEALALKIDDSLRPLTPKGREKTRKVAKVMKDYVGEIEFLVTSPLLRAKQTADELKQVLNFGRMFEVTELVPDAPPQAFARCLQAKVARGSSILAIGHEPQMSVFASWSLAGTSESFIDLKKCGAICLEFESFDLVGPKSAELKWMLSPKLFS